MTDSQNHIIRKITPEGVVSTIAGTAGATGSNDGTGTAARFNHPHGITVDSGGNLYVTDLNNHTIRMLTPSGADFIVSTIAGIPGSLGATDGPGTTAKFNAPSGIIAAGTNLYVADFNNHIIRKLTSSHYVSTIAGVPGSPGATDGTALKAKFYRPRGIAIDNSGALYVTDTFNHTIRKIVFP